MTLLLLFLIGYWLYINSQKTTAKPKSYITTHEDRYIDLAKEWAKQLDNLFGSLKKDKKSTEVRGIAI